MRQNALEEHLPQMKDRRILSAFLALAGMALLYWAGPPMYETNDDILMISVLTGQFGLPAYPDGIFLSLPLSYLFYYLYQWKEGFPWYSVTLYFAQWIGCYLGLRMILATVKDFFQQLLLIFAFLSVYSFIFLRLNFASTSLFLWFMVCLYIAFIQFTKRAVGTYEWLLGGLLGFSFLIRPSISYVAICYTFPILLSLFYQLKWKRLFYILAPLLLCILLSLGFDRVFHANTSFKEYEQWNTARSNFMDTAMGDFHEGTPDALQKTGWSLDDYRMAKLLWVHDEKIFSEDHFTTFLAWNNQGSRSLFSIEKGIASLQSSIRYLLIGMGGILLLFVSPTRSYDLSEDKKKIIRRTIVVTISVIVVGILVLACIRFPNRVALPLYLYLFGLILITRPIFRKSNRGYLRTVFSVAVGAYLLFLTIYNYGNLQQQGMERRRDKTSFEESVQVLQKKYQDPLFIQFRINLVADSANPFREFQESVAYRSLPTSWLIRSPYYYKSLKQYGLTSGEELPVYTVDHQNAIYVFYQSGDYFQFSAFSRYFENFLQTHYASRFPNQHLQVVPVYTRLYPDGEGKEKGWFFFTIQTKKEYQ